MPEKIEIRNKFLDIRNNFSNDYINEISKEISNKIFNMEQYKNAKNIFIYLSFGKELNTSYIINKAIEDNKSIYCPVLTGKKREMIFKKYTDEKCLVKNKFGILEPLYEPEKVSDEQTLIIVPALSFNKSKYRIGYGGGYYDTFLKNNIYMCSICICFEQFLSDFNEDIYDEKLNIVVTEKNIY